MTPFVQVRELHRRVAPFVLLPLLVTACSGVGYRLARDWFGFHRDQVHWLMMIHEGEWLGSALEPVFVLLNGYYTATVHAPSLLRAMMCLPCQRQPCTQHAPHQALPILRSAV